MSTLMETTEVTTFRALGDPVRSGIVEYLSATDGATVNELAALFPISLQAVSKHIKVLQAAGLVSQRREGRERPVRLEQQQVASAGGWLDARLRQLERRYERLDQVLADLQEGTPT